MTRGRRVYTSVPVYHDSPEYNLYGVTDCIEAEAQNLGKGTESEDLKGKELCIVEYKPTKPKDGTYRMEDLMQIADENKLMPPKSTWFEPKLRSGLFIHKLS